MARKKKEVVDQLFASLAEKRAASRKAIDTLEEKAAILASSYTPCQAVVRKDNSRLRAIRVPRRGGKSEFIFIETLEKALLTPNSDWVIVGLSRPAVKRIYWRRVLQYDERFMLGGRTQNTEMIYTLPNGARVSFVGADNRAEMEKLRGNAFNGVVIDECASFNTALLKELIFDVIMPALSDRLGQLTLIGTPGDLLAGPFYEATAVPPVRIPASDGHRWSNRLKSFRGGEPPKSMLPRDNAEHIWSLHRWYVEDNTAMPHIWKEALDKKQLLGWPDDHPTWLREQMGEWVPSYTFRVYRYQPDLHDWQPKPDVQWGIPETLRPDLTDWTLVCGVDFGWNDQTGIVVWAYTPNLPDLWCIYAEKRPQQNFKDVAVWLKALQTELGQFETIVADLGHMKGQAIPEFSEVYGIDMVPADKANKNDFIEAFNTDLDGGRLHILPNGQYSQELLENQWKLDTIGTSKKTENPKTPNDLCDAALYSYRFIYNHAGRPKNLPALVGSREWWDIVEAEELARLRGVKRAHDRAAALDDVQPVYGLVDMWEDQWN